MEVIPKKKNVFNLLKYSKTVESTHTHTLKMLCNLKSVSKTKTIFAFKICSFI